MQTMTTAISGMSCGGCVSNVRKAISAVRGARVDALTVGSATIRYDATLTTPAAILQAIRNSGYEPASTGAPVAVGASDKEG